MTSFKVIATIEENGTKITAVPGGWEKNGELFYPPNSLNSRDREELRKDAGSVPENTWLKCKCVVKCSQIKTFKEAQNVEVALTQCLDTEDEERTSFKVIATTEENGTKMTAVPAGWENNGELSYPPNSIKPREREKLRKDAGSIPENTWLKCKCVVKCSQIKTFKEAQKVEVALTQSLEAENAERTSFKVISTIEEKGTKITAVPAGWEKNGELFYPPNSLNSREREELRKDAGSVPENTWLKCKCVVKCSQIKTFREAQNVEVALTQCLDTNNEESENETSCNSSLDDVTYDIKFISQPNLIVENEGIPAAAEEKVDIVKEIKEYIDLQTAEILDYVDKLVATIGQVSQMPRINGYQDPATKVQQEILDNYRLPLDSIVEVSAFEDALKSNELLKKQVIEKLLKTINCNNDGDATKIGYKVVDKLFTSEVLRFYSWTGISRSKNISKKENFSLLKGILSIFFEMMFKADQRQTQEKTEFFFKHSVLRHANKRHLRKSGIDCQEGGAEENLTTEKMPHLDFEIPHFENEIKQEET